MLPAAFLLLALLGSATASFNDPNGVDIGYGDHELGTSTIPASAGTQVPRGLYDVRCVGEAKDYCRYVGVVGSSSNPVRFACALNVGFSPALTASPDQAEIELKVKYNPDTILTETLVQQFPADHPTPLPSAKNGACYAYTAKTACQSATQWYYRANNKCDTCFNSATDKVDCLNCLINAVYHNNGYDACTAKLTTGDSTYYNCVKDQKDQYGGPGRCKVCNDVATTRTSCFTCVTDNINHNGVNYCAPALTTAQANQAYYDCVKDAKDAPTNVLDQCAVCAKKSTTDLATTCYACVVNYKWTNGGKCPT